MRGLFAAVMLMGIYSFLGASWMLLLDAPDVAFTEASVGAGISTILALATLAYGTLDMPHFGDPEAPASNYPHPSYVERTEHDIHVPNVVTAVLASYRGYDTLGETVVIFTAGIAVLVLLRGSRKRRPTGGGGEDAG